jgi:hypothetical protein
VPTPAGRRSVESYKDLGPRAALPPAEFVAFQREAEKSSLPFHPAWLVVVGAVLVLVAVLVWTVFLA